MSDLVLFRGNRVEELARVSVFDPETLRMMYIQLRAYGKITPQLTYYTNMAWEGFFLHPRFNVMEEIKITIGELSWIVTENAEGRDRLLEGPPYSAANMAVVSDPADPSQLCIIVMYWKDNRLHVAKVNPPVGEDHWLFSEFTHYRVISRKGMDLRWE